MTSTSLGRRSRPQLKGDAREASLLATAERLLRAGDFAAASVAELARAAGVSRPTFYFYFASKDALLASAVDVAHNAIADRLEAALLAVGAPADRLQSAICAAADAWWEHRAVMAAAMELAHRVPELGVRMRAAMDGVNALCAQLLLAHGTVPEGRDPAAATALVATLALLNERVFSHEVASARRRADLRPAEARLLAVWTRTLGIAPPA